MGSEGKRPLPAMHQTLFKPELNELVSIKLPTLYRYMLLNEYSIYQRRRPLMMSYMESSTHAAYSQAEMIK